MANRRFTAALIAVTLIGSSAASVGLVEAQVSSVQEPVVNEEMPYWMGFRAQQGWVTDVEVIARIARTKDGAVALDRYGVPMTAGELAEFEYRFELADDAATMIDDLRDQPGFADIYMDFGQIVVNFNRELNGLEQAEIRATSRNIDRVEFRSVRFSLAELERAFDAVRDVLPEIGEIVSVGIDPRENKVAIEFDGQDSTVRSELRLRIATEMLPLMSEEEVAISNPGLDSSGALSPVFVLRPGKKAAPSACVSRNDCGSGSTDFRGGLAVRHNPEPTLCTSGFVGTAPNGDDFLVTAAHCDWVINRNIKVGNQTGYAFSGPSPFRENFLGVDLGDDADAVRISIPDSKKSHRIYKNNNNKSHAIWNVKATTTYVVGSTACIGSLRVNFRCGTIQLSSATVAMVVEVQISPTESTLGNFLVNDQFKWTWTWGGFHDDDDLNGASGGPIFAGQKALGLLSSTSTQFYTAGPGFTIVTMNSTKIHNVEHFLDVQIRTAFS